LQPILGATVCPDFWTHLEADYLRFLDIAHGSSREVEYQLSLAGRLGYLSADAYRELSGMAVETAKVLNALLRSLRH
jgi:four helix bundle protein